MELIINCEQKFRKAVEVARDTRDTSLRDCVFRLLTWNGVSKVFIYSDCEEHSFLFTTYDKDGNVDICGGIIYYGNPKTGYSHAGSVQLSPSYGWHIHT